MTETISQQKEFVFISVDGKQTKNHAILQSTAEQHSSNINNYNVIDDSSDNISSTFYTNYYSDQQPIYNETKNHAILQPIAEQHSSNVNNYNVIDDSSDNISSTFYTNHYSDQQPIYNENITSTLPPGSSPCVPGPQQTIENTTFPLSPFNMNSVNPSQSEIRSFDIPGYKIIIIPTFSQQDNTYLNYSSSDISNQFAQF